MGDEDDVYKRCCVRFNFFTRNLALHVLLSSVDLSLSLDILAANTSVQLEMLSLPFLS